ncbi:hypothetical protein [Azospirillum palustre]
MLPSARQTPGGCGAAARLRSGPDRQDRRMCGMGAVFLDRGVSGNTGPNASCRPKKRSEARMGERKLAMSFRSLLLEEVHDRYRGALAFGDAAQAAEVKLPRDARRGVHGFLSTLSMEFGQTHFCVLCEIPH